jgi:hypothetical protein
MAGSTARIGAETRARIAAAWPDMLAELADGGLIFRILGARAISASELRVYKAENPVARQEWEDAREQSAEAFMDDAIDTANNPEHDPAHARVKIDTLKWAARIRNPRAYGDKAQLDVNVKTLDLTRIISDAQARLAASRVIEGQVIRVTLPDLESLM